MDAMVTVADGKTAAVIVCFKGNLSPPAVYPCTLVDKTELLEEPRVAGWRRTIRATELDFAGSSMPDRRPAPELSKTPGSRSWSACSKT